jgi:hypothetical protein
VRKSDLRRRRLRGLGVMEEWSTGVMGCWSDGVGGGPSALSSRRSAGRREGGRSRNQSGGEPTAQTKRITGRDAPHRGAATPQAETPVPPGHNVADGSGLSSPKPAMPSAPPALIADGRNFHQEMDKRRSLRSDSGQAPSAAPEKNSGKLQAAHGLQRSAWGHAIAWPLIPRKRRGRAEARPSERCFDRRPG